MVVKKVLIKPLEPLMFRSQGEFEPLITGSHTSAQSLIIPRPSTIAGLFGYILFNGTPLSNNDWLDNVVHLLDNMTIYGTLIEADGKYLFPLRMGNLFALVKQKTLSSLPDLLKGGEEYEKWEKGIYDIFYEKNFLFELIGSQDRIGISIDKQTRTVKEHYLYTARYISFKERNIAYAVFIDSDDKSDKMKGASQPVIETLFAPNKIDGMNGKVINFGGESRVVKIEVKNSDDVIIEGVNEDYYLALSPILIPDDSLDDFLDNVTKYVAMGKVDKITLGFDISRKRRKEMRTAVLEGSVIKKDFINAFKGNDRFEKYQKIGYNTITPLNKLKLGKVNVY
ncbi:type III-B CRISPR module-associated protein Cmr3 [Acidianus hospitalis]|uniref:Type III-B CRISPR module-associated protein Cmr3 n=1 Tax=Acidianus hospitalis TaxID=563177 RepID=A0A2T9X2S4_9CREN|nr:type III-B CRISPR module-associated protein Cmr3 [Acidianus hospitalis]